MTSSSAAMLLSSLISFQLFVRNGLEQCKDKVVYFQLRPHHVTCR